MNTEQIEAFIAVYENNSFSKASEKLLKSQSAVTQLVKSLEDELGATLFQRHTRPVKPTDNGNIFYPHRINILAEIDISKKAVISEADKNYILSYRVRENNIVNKFVYNGNLVKIPQIEDIPIANYSSTDNWESNHLYFVREDILKSKSIYHQRVYQSRVYALVSSDDPLSVNATLTSEDLSGRTVVLPGFANGTNFAVNMQKILSQDKRITIVSTKGSAADKILIRREHYIGFSTEEFFVNDDKFRYIPCEQFNEIPYCFASLEPFTKEMKRFIKGFNEWVSKNE